jgi:hypothetical protein
MLPRVLNVFLLLFLIFLCIGGLWGWQIAFGHGLGDLSCYIVLWLLAVAHLAVLIRNWKTKSRKYITVLIFFSLTTLLICLKATIWRGPEYSWSNRKIFYNVSAAGWDIRLIMQEAGNAILLQNRHSVLCHQQCIIKLMNG